MRFKISDRLIDTDRHLVTHNGDDVPVEPQVFDLIVLLARNADRLLTKDEMVDEIWDGRIVSEATISSRISTARSALGDNGKEQRVIKTVARRGIELVAPVEILDTSASPAPVAPMTMKQKVQFTTASDGTRIAMATSGQGPVVLRGGHFLTHLEAEWDSVVWGPYLRKLSQHHRVVRYDMRGVGLSERNPHDLTLAAYASDMLAVADAMELDRFPLIAASMSVPVSIYMAAHHPDRISRLVLYGGFAQGRNKRPEKQSHTEAAMLLEMMKMGWGRRDGTFMRAFATLYCPGANAEELDDIARMQLVSATAEQAVATRIALDDFDALDCLARIDVPTLVIHARGDALQPVEQGRIIAAGIRGAEFVELDSQNHIYLYSDPAWNEFVDRILSFVAED